MSPAFSQTPFAAIDLGSNTVRLLVAAPRGSGIGRLVQRQTTTRLGKGLKPGGRLDPEAIARTWEVLKEYKGLIEATGAGRTLVGATMAVRQAGDGEELLERIRSELGFDAVLLSGEGEARATFRGVMTALDPVPEKTLVFDLGGRSTEFIHTIGLDPAWTVSLPLGAVALTEAFFKNDPPAPEKMEACRADIRKRIEEGLTGRDFAGGLVGTAGTTTTLAAMDQQMAEYDRTRIDNHLLLRERLIRLIDRMKRLPAAGRAGLPGLPPDRADVILAGALVVLEIMDYTQAKQLIVSDAGLLEGIWLAAADSREMVTS